MDADGSSEVGYSEFVVFIVVVKLLEKVARKCGKSEPSCELVLRLSAVLPCLSEVLGRP